MTIFDDFTPESFYQDFEEDQNEGSEPLTTDEILSICDEVDNLYK